MADLHLSVAINTRTVALDMIGLVNTSMISDSVYGAGWDSITTVGASKNVLYDKFESITGGLSWSVTAINANAVNGDGFFVNATSGAVTITLPATPIVGDTVAVSDFYEMATTNTITVARNGSYIEGVAEDLVLDIDGLVVTLTYADATKGWDVTSLVVSSRSATVSLPTKYLTGLEMSHATDTEHDITVAAGKAKDDSDAANMVLATAITKQADATWAVGTGAGGMASGESLPTSGTIHVWLIKRSDTGVVDVMFNNNATTGISPTLPTGYDYKRRIGSYRTDSSANILNGDWWGTDAHRTFKYDSPILDSSAEPGDTNAHTITISVPAGIKVKALMVGNTTSGGFPYVSSLDSVDMAASYSAAPLASFDCSVAGGYGTGQFAVMTDTSSQIRYRNVVNSITRFVTLGWEDSL